MRLWSACFRSTPRRRQRPSVQTAAAAPTTHRKPPNCPFAASSSCCAGCSNISPLTAAALPLPATAFHSRCPRSAAITPARISPRHCGRAQCGLPQRGRTAAGPSRANARPQRGVRTTIEPRATTRTPTAPLVEKKAAIIATGVWATFKLAYFAPAAAGVMGGLARPRGHPMLRYAEADLAISSSFYVLS